MGRGIFPLFLLPVYEYVVCIGTASIGTRRGDLAAAASAASVLPITIPNYSVLGCSLFLFQVPPPTYNTLEYDIEWREEKLVLVRSNNSRIRLVRERKAKARKEEEVHKAEVEVRCYCLWVLPRVRGPHRAF